MSNDEKLLLQQVRESFRFLFEYQTKVLNLMKYIERKLGVSYSGGFSKFSNVTPRNGKGRLDFWAWDWLNLYFYEFHFGFYDREMKLVPLLIDGNDSNDFFGFSVFLLSDDGYFLSHLDATTNVDRVVPNSFLPTEQSNTKLIFVASKNVWDLTWWHNPENGKSVHKDFVTMEYGIKEFGENRIMVFKSFDLSLFFNEIVATNSLKEFEYLCSTNGIIFSVLQSDFL